MRKLTDEAGESGHRCRPHQAMIVARKAPVVLFEAKLHQSAKADLNVADGFASG